MNAVILAGGFGSRLQSLTDNTPKPMVSIANTPMLDYSVSHLWDAGIKSFVFTLNYKPQDIIEWCIGYKGATCRFSLETDPLGTLGGVKAVEDFLDDVFIVASGDCLHNISIPTMVNKHINSGASITMAVTYVNDVSQFGVPQIDPYGKVVDFYEKQATRGGGGLVNTGFYIVNKSILATILKDVKLDFALDLFPTLAVNNKLHAYIHDGYWQDAGTLERYYDANFYIKNNLLNTQVSNLVAPQNKFFRLAPNKFRTPNQPQISNDIYNSFATNLHIDYIDETDTSNKYSDYITTQSNQSLISSTADVLGKVKNSIIGHDAYIGIDASLSDCIVLPNAKVTTSQTRSIIGKGFIYHLDEPLTKSYTFGYTGDYVQ